MPRLFRTTTPIEATEALAITLVELAPQAVAQLGGSAREAIHEAALSIYREIVRPAFS
jgi:hypothetical protein